MRKRKVRRSKLESYEDILESLVNKPMTCGQIARQADMNDTLLNRLLGFLMENSLIEERATGKKASYAITERGVAVLKALNFQKYLGKIKDTIRAIDEAMQVLPSMSKETREI